MLQPWRDVWSAKTTKAEEDVVTAARVREVKAADPAVSGLGG